MRQRARFSIAFVCFCGLEIAACYACLHFRPQSREVEPDVPADLTQQQLDSRQPGETKQASGDEQLVEEQTFFKGLGSYSRKVSTTSALAQRYFDQGLALYTAFDDPAAFRSFKAAAAADPTCVMALWGIEISNGPSLNRPFFEGERMRVALRHA